MKKSLLYQVGEETASPGERRAAGALEAWVTELRLAEELGLNSVWCFPVAGEMGDFSGSAPEIWLAALAARTERLRIGWGVPGMMPPAKPPFRIAEQAATLDLSSKGRLEFAVLPAVGEAAPDSTAVSASDEPQAWAEGARMLVDMWDAPAFSWTSQRFEVMPIDVVPKPLQRPHPPIWFAGWSAEHAHRAGALGMSYLDLSGAGEDTLEVHLNAYRKARKSVDASDLLSISAFAVAAEIPPNALGEARLARWAEMEVDQAVLPLSLEVRAREENEQRIRFLASSSEAE